MKQTHFFLGANSAEGFYGLYDQLLDARLYDLIILKGTPGCGKSTFMRRVGAAHEGRLAAARAAFQNHQIVEPTAQKLVIEREKALFAVCAEEKVHRFHKIPPKIGAFSIAYACVAVPASRPSQILFVRQQRSVIQE